MNTTQSPRTKSPKPKPSNRYAEADERRSRVLGLISELGHRITGWFDTAPSELHNEFAELLRKRIAELID